MINVAGHPFSFHHKFCFVLIYIKGFLSGGGFCPGGILSRGVMSAGGLFVVFYPERFLSYGVMSWIQQETIDKIYKHCVSSKVGNRE